jgi:hypothetical protein
LRISKIMPRGLPQTSRRLPADSPPADSPQTPRRLPADSPQTSRRLPADSPQTSRRLPADFGSSMRQRRPANSQHQFNSCEGGDLTTASTAWSDLTTVSTAWSGLLPESVPCQHAVCDCELIRRSPSHMKQHKPRRFPPQRTREERVGAFFRSDACQGERTEPAAQPQQHEATQAPPLSSAAHSGGEGWSFFSFSRTLRRAHRIDRRTPDT